MIPLPYQCCSINYCFSVWVGTNNVFSDMECQFIGRGSKTALDTCQVIKTPLILWLFSLQKSCEETESCTAINWKYKGNHECILRACSLPVVPPMETLPMWKAYYLTTPTTTTTTATPITTTIPIFDGLHFKSIQLAFVNFLNLFYSTQIYFVTLTFSILHF